MDCSSAVMWSIGRTFLIFILAANHSTSPSWVHRARGLGGWTHTVVLCVLSAATPLRADPRYRPWCCVFWGWPEPVPAGGHADMYNDAFCVSWTFQPRLTWKQKMSKVANEKMRATAVEENSSVWEGDKKAAAATAASPSTEASTSDALATVAASAAPAPAELFSPASPAACTGLSLAWMPSTPTLRPPPAQARRRDGLRAAGGVVSPRPAGDPCRARTRRGDGAQGPWGFPFRAEQPARWASSNALLFERLLSMGRLISVGLLHYWYR